MKAILSTEELEFVKNCIDEFLEDESMMLDFTGSTISPINIMDVLENEYNFSKDGSVNTDNLDDFFVTFVNGDCKIKVFFSAFYFTLIVTHYF